MISKELGKITSAEFGSIRDYPFLFGLQLTFSLGSGICVEDGGKYTVNLSDSCKWDSKTQKYEAIEKYVAKFTYDTLRAAKVNCVSQLVGKPVEVEIEANCFKDFRSHHDDFTIALGTIITKDFNPSLEKILTIGAAAKIFTKYRTDIPKLQKLI